MEQSVTISRILREALPYAHKFEKILYELQSQYYEKNAHMKRIQELKDPRPLGLNVIYIVGAILLIGSIINGITVIVEDSSDVLQAIGPIAVILVFGILLITYIKNDRVEEFQGKIKRYNELERSIPEVEAELNRVADEAIELGYDFIPLDYFNTSAIEFFISVFDRYLARDMHEAVALYEQALMRDEEMRMQEERHKALMEQLTLLDIHIMLKNRH